MFLQQRGKVRHTHSSRRKAWESLKKQIDISMGATDSITLVADDFVPYCFRHTYCTDLQDAGVPLNVAKYLMGHADVSTTGNIYTHTTEQSIDDAATMINSRSGKDGGQIMDKTMGTVIK